MTITIELPEDLVMRLAAAGIPASDASRYAVAALEEVAESAEVRAWWDGLSDTARETEKAIIEESLTVANAGYSGGATEVYARIRARHNPGLGK